MSWPCPMDAAYFASNYSAWKTGGNWPRFAGQLTSWVCPWHLRRGPHLSSPLASTCSTAVAGLPGGKCVVSGCHTQCTNMAHVQNNISSRGKWKHRTAFCQGGRGGEGRGGMEENNSLLFSTEKFLIPTSTALWPFPVMSCRWYNQNLKTYHHCSM